MQLDNLYQEVILDHYKNPQNKKLSATYDAQVHHVNPSCGDEIDLNVTIKDGESCPQSRGMALVVRSRKPVSRFSQTC
jgi:hypothetical protein